MSNGGHNGEDQIKQKGIQKTKEEIYQTAKALQQYINNKKSLNVMNPEKDKDGLQRKIRKLHRLEGDHKVE